MLMAQHPSSFKDIIKNIPLSSWMRQEFFAIHLFKQQMFSMSDDLALMLAQYLRVHRGECCNQKIRRHYKSSDKSIKKSMSDWKNRMNHLCVFGAQHQKKLPSKEEKNDWNDIQNKAKYKMFAQDVQRYTRLLPILWNKFNKFRENQTVIRFDIISDILKTFFMEETNEKDIKTKKMKYILSFDEIIRVYPNAKELIFMNEYE